MVPPFSNIHMIFIILKFYLLDETPLLEELLLFVVN